MPEATLEVAGSLVRVKPVVVLAESPSLVLAASLEEAPWRPPRRAVEALAQILAGDPRGALASMDPLEAALAVAAAYGGIVLVSKTRPPAAMARLVPGAGLMLERGACSPSPLADGDLVEAWARIYWGDPVGPRCTVEPGGYKWGYPGPLQVAPVGYESKPLSH